MRTTYDAVYEGQVQSPKVEKGGEAGHDARLVSEWSANGGVPPSRDRCKHCLICEQPVENDRLLALITDKLCIRCTYNCLMAAALLLRGHGQFVFVQSLIQGLVEKLEQKNGPSAF